MKSSGLEGLLCTLRWFVLLAVALPALATLQAERALGQLCGAPVSGCRSAGKSVLLIKNNPGDDAKDRLTWRWLKGAATTLADFGVPTGTTAYALCIYAGTSIAAIAEADSAPSPTLWRPKGTTGFRYMDRTLSSNGIRKVILKAGADGKAKAVVRGKGANLPDPPAGPLPLPVTAQLVNSANHVCFEGVYGSAAVEKNDAARFKARTISSDLYVAASGGLNGDGSVSNPYRRITDAVARARADRASGAVPPAHVIRVHVAPGVYVGSFDPTEVQNHPEYEVLPVILNVPRLAILGSTVLVRDDRGLPIGSESEGETILEPNTPPAQFQFLVLITRTSGDAIGNEVTLEGFSFEGRSGAFNTGAVFVDRVSDFRIRNNLMQHGDFGVNTRLASGTLEGNLLAENGEATSVTGGSLTEPATVLLRANRATRNMGHGFINLATGVVALILDAGSNPPDLADELSQPLQTTFDRNDPGDLQNIPDTLTVTLSGNDASDNGQLGIRFMGNVHPLDYRTADDTQALTGTLTADLVGNTSVGNGDYGVDIEGGFTVRDEPRPFVQNLSVHFAGNSFVENRAGALFTFRHWEASVGAETLQAFKFAEDSNYQVTDADGELAGYDYDNPLMDPLAGTVLNNTLTVNGVEVPHGASITPP